MTSVWYAIDNVIADIKNIDLDQNEEELAIDLNLLIKQLEKVKEMLF